jgi:HD-GYP domain-containing protein (c-di-GMP phosphodiesterase class II)/DNA-binding CsgD family transcriptional regulator
MPDLPSTPAKVRLAELVASLSLATDLGMGQPMEQALSTCLLSTKVAGELGVSGSDLSDVYYLALLRFIGCTADAHEAAAAAGGDEISDHAGMATVIMGDSRELLGYMLRHFAAGNPPITRLRLLADAFTEGRGGAKRTIAAHCEVAQMLAQRMGLRETIGRYVGSTFERWDGKGVPGELAGEAIPVAARIVSVARDVDVFNRIGGWDLTRDVLRRRGGRAYDPRVADAFLRQGEEWLTKATATSAWDAVLSAEPAPQVLVGESQLDAVLGAFADFVDLKSPFTLGHSSGVATLAASAASGAGLTAREVDNVRRAGLVHDLGQTGIPNGIWEKPGSLSPSEWERVRLHPYLTERILARSPPLAQVSRLAGAHHERLDGSGYHRGSGAAALPFAARILAAADAYQAMGQMRPHRPALDQQARVRQLQADVDAGRLDRDAVQAVLKAAGLPMPPRPHFWPKGLTDREVEVLRLISRGASNRVVARELVISPKTAGRHVENIYGKIDVSSRASAALFALQNGLLDD